MLAELAMFPGLGAQHTLVTIDCSEPTPEKYTQFRRAYSLKSCWINLNARLFTVQKMLAESRAVMRACTVTIDYLARVYGKELVVTNKFGRDVQDG